MQISRSQQIMEAARTHYKRKYTHLNMLYKNYANKASFLVQPKSLNTMYM
jgi:hypothetical protein